MAKKKKRTPPPAPSGLARGKSLVGWAAFLSLVGVGLIGVGETTVGPFVTLGAAAAFVYGAHLIGRSGPDEGKTPATRA